MTTVTGPRGPRPLQPVNAGVAREAAWAVGTFKPVGWGLGSPFRQLSVSASGEFSASLRKGGQLTGRFEFRDGAAAFMDTVRLTGTDGREQLFAVLDAKRDGAGAVSEFKLAPFGETSLGRPFTLRRS